MSKDSSRQPAKVEPVINRPIFKWDIADGLVLWLLAFRGPQYFVSEIAQYTPGLLSDNQNLRNDVLYLFIEVLTIGLLAVFMRFYALRLRDLGLTKFKLNWLFDVVVGYFAYFALTVVLSNIGKALRLDLNQAQDLGFNNLQPAELVITFILLVMAVPMAEELLFRGFLFRVFRKRATFWVTTVLVSVLFGMVHGNLGVGIDVFALSLVLCYLRETTNSLWPSILLHGLKNAIAFTIVYIVK